MQSIPVFPWFLGSCGPLGAPRGTSDVFKRFPPFRWDLHQCLVARVALQIGREESRRPVAKLRPTKLLELLCHLIGVKVLHLSHGCTIEASQIRSATIQPSKNRGVKQEAKDFGGQKTFYFT